MRALLCALLAVVMSGPIVEGQTEKRETTPQVKVRSFGKTHDGREAHLYTLSNKSGMEVSITDYGANTVSIKVPDRNGNIGDVVLGFDSVSGYEDDKSYIGATVGRYGNRIAGAKFKLDGKEYTLPKNDGENHLHGGFNKVFWDVAPGSLKNPSELRLHYISKDGEEGFPGNLSVDVVFSVTNANEFKIDYTAKSDKKTVLNLTHHSYFNLAGSGTVLDYQLTLLAGKFTPVDKGLIPTGELRPVAGTPFDFRQATAVGARIEQDDEQIKTGHGYDHNWVLDAGMNDKPVLAATLFDPTSGRVMQVLTTEPGLQVYTGNFLDGTIKGKGGQAYQRRSAICLETQHFPDSPNHPDFPSTTMAANKKFHSTTIYKFSTK
jgi:aldose 1-epimerase